MVFSRLFATLIGIGAWAVFSTLALLVLLACDIISPAMPRMVAFTGLLVAAAGSCVGGLVATRTQMHFRIEHSCYVACGVALFVPFVAFDALKLLDMVEGSEGLLHAVPFASKHTFHVLCLLVSFAVVLCGAMCGCLCDAYDPPFEPSPAPRAVPA